jgi:hypothetical protein
LPAYRIQFARFEIRGQKGKCDTARRMIRLSREFQDDPDGLRRELLHEMCHIGSPGHGRRFQAKLARLAAAGESWAEKERRDFADRPRGYLTGRLSRQTRKPSAAEPIRGASHDRFFPIGGDFPFLLGRDASTAARSGADGMLDPQDDDSR